MQRKIRLLPTRRSRLEVIVLFLWLTLLATFNGSSAEDLQPRAAFENVVPPFVTQYCADCHSADTASGKAISFAPYLDQPDFRKDRKFWQQVALRLHTSEMPPADAILPSTGERTATVKWLREELDNVSCEGPRDPGPAVLRRVNRTQYQNTLRDWLGVEFDATSIFPPDDLAYGFDNSGDALALTSLQVEKYLTAAERVASLAIVAPETITEPAYRIRSRDLRGGAEYGRRGKSLITNGSIVASFEVSEDGDYLLRAQVSADQAGGEFARMAFADREGRKLKEVEILGEQSDDPQVAVLPMELKPGRQEFAVAFLNDYYDASHPDADERDRNFYLHQLELIGPLDEKLPASHTKLLDDCPSISDWQDEKAWKPAVTRMLNRWLGQAYRRPATKDEIARLQDLIVEARGTGATFERAMQLALQAILVSPQFLFIAPPTEATPAESESFAVKPVDEFTLASRLSYFLWSTMPDEELLRLAKRGELRKNLDQQVRRMLTDDRAMALARNFGGSWLQSRELANIELDTEKFEDFNNELRADMQREVELFFAEIVRQDRSVFDFLRADFTFANERLARLYGIDGVSGEEFRRVEFRNSQRGGVLTMAAVLTVTSNPSSTSPVKRGKWILGQILGDEPPPPPPDVPDLAAQEEGEKELTLREKLAQHRADADCAVCHLRMDPMGLSLENFDALGRWRDEEDGQKIDVSGELPGGVKFEGAKGLRQLLLAEQPMFRRNLAQQMLIYAIGRGLQSDDACTITDVANRLEAEDDKFSALVLGIVHSTPFQQQRVSVQAKE